MIALPAELQDRILGSCTDGTLAALACVSRTCWRITCPVLWKSLPTAVPLLALLDQREKMWRVSKQYRPIPSENVSTCFTATIDCKVTDWKVSEGYHEQQFTRWTEYAVFVRNLTIGSVVLTSSERSFLVKKAVGKDLLPTLKVLTIGELTEGQGAGWGHLAHVENLENAEDLTLIFAAKSLETLAISHHRIPINFSVLSARCPELRDIRLGYDDQYPGSDSNRHSFGRRSTPKKQTEGEGALGYA